MNTSLIKINNLAVSRNDNLIFSNISFEVVKSYAINIFGGNGSGKTTLLKTMIGITEPSNGRVENLNTGEFHEKIVYVGHKSGLKKDLTVTENLLFFQNFCNEGNQRLIQKALEAYKMSSYKDTPIKFLSHGQKKRVCLMKTLITNSLLWIIDEPYSSLDDDAVEIFNFLARNYLKNGGALVLTNHKPLKNTFEKLLNIEVGNHASL